MEQKQNMKYVNLFFILCVICMRGYAQPSYTIQHVKNALVISTYELDGNCFHHKGHTIKIDKKAYPFFVRSEQNIWILRNVFDVDSAECEQYEDMDFAYHVDKGIYNQDLYISDFEKGYMGNQRFSSCFYSKRLYRKRIYAAYKYTGDIVVYDLDGFAKTKKYQEASIYTKNVLDFKKFAMIKYAEKLNWLSKEDMNQNHFKHSGICTIWLYAPE